MKMSYSSSLVGIFCPSNRTTRSERKICLWTCHQRRPSVHFDKACSIFFLVQAKLFRARIYSKWVYWRGLKFFPFQLIYFMYWWNNPKELGTYLIYYPFGGNSSHWMTARSEWMTSLYRGRRRHLKSQSIPSSITDRNQLLGADLTSTSWWWDDLTQTTFAWKSRLCEEIAAAYFSIFLFSLCCNLTSWKKCAPPERSKTTTNSPFFTTQSTASSRNTRPSSTPTTLRPNQFSILYPSATFSLIRPTSTHLNARTSSKEQFS